MKQLDLLPKRAKPKFCDKLYFDRGWKKWKKCNQPATVQIGGAFYCAGHAEAAQKYFGQGKPIYA